LQLHDAQDSEPEYFPLNENVLQTVIPQSLVYCVTAVGGSLFSNFVFNVVIELFIASCIEFVRFPKSSPFQFPFILAAV
jgi:hypothetical protein